MRDVAAEAPPVPDRRREPPRERAPAGRPRVRADAPHDLLHVRHQDERGQPERQQRPPRSACRRPRAGPRARRPASAGTARRGRSCSPLVRRQDSSGPTPIRKSSSRNTGADRLRRSTARRPSPACSVDASTNSGKIVPSRTTSVSTSSTMLLPRNAASRERTASNRPSERSRQARQRDQAEPAEQHQHQEPQVHRPDRGLRERVDRGQHAAPGQERAERRQGERPDDQRRGSRPCTCPGAPAASTECRNAVAISHGSSATFSTGSHAQ